MRRRVTLPIQAVLLLTTSHAFTNPTSNLREHSRQLGSFPSLSSSKSSNQDKKHKKRQLSIAELRQELLKNPAKFQAVERRTTQKHHRTRKRVDNPKQRYFYKGQRDALERAGKLERNKKTQQQQDDDDDESDAKAKADAASRDPLLIAREFGLKVNSQHCDPLVDEIEPKILGQIRVGDESGSGAYAYLIEKPAGWSILGGGGRGGRAFPKEKAASTKRNPKQPQSRKYTTRVKVQEEDGLVDYVEYDERDILARMTPQELEEYNQEDDSIPATSRYRTQDIGSSRTDRKITTQKVQEGSDTDSISNIKENKEVDGRTAANIRRIAARSQQMKDGVASFASRPRPSVVAWLKETKAKGGVPIRGGNFWKALAGATEVDDSGVVLLCPKTNVDNVFLEYTEYITVMGSGGYLAPRSMFRKDTKLATESIKLEVMSKLRTGREDDVVQTVRVIVPETTSTCTSIVKTCQAQFQQGVRGDPAANPFDRRARRRLVHCNSLSASSLLYEETIEAESMGLPSDLSILSERGVNLEYKSGSFLGRSSLRENPLTTTYREINGAADGFPGWTVDRYDKWLFVQHDPRMPKGPLPSIHDGNTAGIYYLEASPDRSAMGSTHGARPRLLEGQPAPSSFTVLENGVKYVVSLDKDLSTGIFLDQRPQRAWLKKNCCETTNVLNCFAHTGAFSVAAAVAGASTVSIDLSQKWMDRLPEHLEANGIPFDERHDCIYGDCFDWLPRLAKRGEKYDIVIIDPPSSSVGRKKKRWSVKNDMDELVAIAAPLVRSGGLLWTTTNSAGIHPIKFARLCRKGLQDAGIERAKLERIQPMPSDFPSIGTQPVPVKNLVWRMP